MKKAELIKTLLTRSIMFLVAMCLMFFVPARTLNFWEAWVYLALIFSCAASVVAYFLKHDPGLLERRMRTKEKVREQKLIIRLAWILFLPTFIIPGFDKYYGWSDIPVYFVIISDFFVLLGYYIVIRVFKENSFASRVVETETSQKVISTGPYALVRHPMYSGMFIMYGFTPFALGSWWAFVSSIILIILIVIRIFSEEKFLAENLEGYKEYLQKVRYRIIPGIW